MTKYRKVPYGYVCDDISNNAYTQSIIMVKERLAAANNDHAIRVMPDVSVFAIEMFKTITGLNLRDFLIANYDNGMGVRSYLVTNIVKYLKGQITADQLASIVKMEKNIVGDYLKTRTTPLPKVSTGHVQEEQIIELIKQVRNDGFNKILAAIGPIKLLELLLTFNMEVQ